MRREGIRRSESRLRSVPLFSLLVPLGFAVVMWIVSSSPVMMLFAVMGPVAMVASMADGWRQSRATQRTASEDADTARIETERLRAEEDEREAARARRQHPSLADLLEHGHHRPVVGSITSGALAPRLFRLGLDPGRRPVLIPLDARLCVVGSPDATRRAARRVTLTRRWNGASAGEGSVTEATVRAAIPAETSLVLTLGERGWGELADVRTPLEVVAVLIDELSEAQVTRVRHELERVRSARYLPLSLRDLRQAITHGPTDDDLVNVDVTLRGEDTERPERSPIIGILGWIDAGIGSTRGPRPVCLELGAEVPHFLVAGATGSGKTETLVALLASMAASYSPEHFRFAVIDFKGGGGFTRVASFAHNAGISTDLDGDDVLRALAGIRNEMERREGILRDAGCTDVSALPASLRLPRLLIVIDEFRALCDTVPDARRIVADVASRGRALGVHLAVATQRAAGAFGDDLLVNAQTRLCLTPVADDDARYLLGQSVPPLSGVDAGTRLLFVRRATGAVESIHPVCVDADTLASARRWEARTEDGDERLWWPALPRVLPEKLVHQSREACGETATGWSLGLRQNARTTRWSVFDFVPERDGSLWVVGPPRSGKTTLLETIGNNATHATVISVPHEPAFAWDAIIAVSHECDGRSAQQPTVVIIDAIDAILRQTREDALDDFVSALERIAREGPRQALFLALSSSADEPLLATVTRHIGLRIALGNRYPGRGTVGGDEIQVTQPRDVPAEGSESPSCADPPQMPALGEVLRGRRAVVLTNTPELWETNTHVGVDTSPEDDDEPSGTFPDVLTPDQALTIGDEMRRRLRTEPVVWHGVGRIAARYVGRDARRIPPAHPGSVVVLEADDTYVRAALPGA